MRLGAGQIADVIVRQADRTIPHVPIISQEAIDVSRRELEIVAVPRETHQRGAIMSGRLILARHSESELDAQDKFSGTLDPPLSEKGDLYALALASCMEVGKVHLDFAFSSPLEACRRTAHTIVHRNGCQKPIVFASELDERDYGPMQGLSRSEAVQRWGEQHVALLQHGSTRPDDPIRARVATLYENQVAPKLRDGAVVLVVSYEDNLDALVALVDPSGEQLAPGTFPTGAALDFRLDADLGLVGRDLIQETRWDEGS